MPTNISGGGRHIISMDAVSVEFSKSGDLYCPCKNGMGGTVPNRPWTLNPKTRPSGCVATVTGFEACWCLGSGWHGQAVSPRSLHTYQCYGSMYTSTSFWTIFRTPLVVESSSCCGGFVNSLRPRLLLSAARAVANRRLSVTTCAEVVCADYGALHPKIPLSSQFPYHFPCSFAHTYTLKAPSNTPYTYLRSSLENML